MKALSAILAHAANEIRSLWLQHSECGGFELEIETE